ncbi:hypothetical protein EXU48_07960 [Occultella glacieicola]|uniref:SGNH domain-containing protein n=1 Tax=Occultella glacieicola TaxID=2518684 RepID=A0ABY2E6E4_9MICO|nr:SGNH hydrolase domain-containing protein [Occultella glacieicola]TDE96157.1 hypothetical protein EXU48_07960 [Occultella glacieicola]
MTVAVRESIANRTRGMLRMAGLVLVLTLAVICVATSRTVATGTPKTGHVTAVESAVGPQDAPSDLTPSLEEAGADQPSTYATGCHLGVPASEPVGCTSGSPAAPLDVVLFGDSHAANWHPALETLATRGDLHVTSHTKSGCPAHQVSDEYMTEPYPECATWREAVLTLIAADPPDVVVLSGLPRGTAAPVPLSEWTAGVAATVERLSVVTTVLVVADTPNFQVDPPACLSTGPVDATTCDRPRSDAINDEYAAQERAAAMAAGGTYADLTDHFCSDTCPVIQGNILLYRDDHHLTATFSASMADALGAVIASALAGP